MSIPVSQCMFLRAAREGGVAEQRYLEIMEYNFRHGAMTIVPCKCSPPCTATKEQAESLWKKTEAVQEKTARRKKK